MNQSLFPDSMLPTHLPDAKFSQRLGVQASSELPDGVLKEALADARRVFTNRGRSYGLLFPALAAWTLAVRRGRTYENFAALEAENKIDTTSSHGSAKNGLTYRSGGYLKTVVSLRSEYNRLENYIIIDQRRLTFSRCAAHATSRWHQYKHWLDVLASEKEEYVQCAANEMIKTILEQIPEDDALTGRIQAQPLLRVLQDFNFRVSGEKPGAAWQGLAVGFMKALSPLLHFCATRVQAAGARLDVVGDVDGWNGARRLVCAEAKHRILTRDDCNNVVPFIRNARLAGAKPHLIAEDATVEAQDFLGDQGVHLWRHSDMVDMALIWDENVQFQAVQAMSHHYVHTEQDQKLRERFSAFVDSEVRQ